MNTLFKKSLITTAFVLMSSSAVAEELAANVDTAKGTFQWSGKVPEAQVNNGVCIAEVEGKTPHHSGVVTFHNKKVDGDTVTHDIQSSSELAFKVYEYDAGVDAECSSGNPVHNYNYALTDLQVGINAEQMKSEYLGNKWQVWHATTGNAAKQLSSNTDALNDTGAEVSLTLAGTDLAVDSGDSVVVHAFVLITNDERG